MLFKKHLHNRTFVLFNSLLINRGILKMKKKTIGILLMISLVMIISISAISAADANETLMEEVSDTDIETISSDIEAEDIATSTVSEAGGEVEKIIVNDTEIEKSNQKVVKASSSSNEVLAASNDDVLKASSGCFLYGGKWYDDLDDAIDEACDNNGGTILIRGGTYGSDSDDRGISISDGVYLTFAPYNSGTVIFDGDNNANWFFTIADKNAHVTFNSITFRNGGAFQGGAIEIDEGYLNVNNCIFENNKASTNLAGGYGWGGAIFIDDDSCSLIARNCRFINNKAASGGGAVCVEGEGSSATFENCYFEGNKVGDEENDVHNKDSGTHSFYYCDFKGSIDGDFNYEVDYAERSVTMTPTVNDDDVNYAVLYKNGNFYDRIACNGNGMDIATFTKLEEGSYTIYMMKNEEKRYSYPKTTFRIINGSFVLNDTEVFENLSAAVNAIPNGGAGVITVAMGTYTETENFNIIIENKNVTIRPKDNSYELVIFSADSQNYLLQLNRNSQLIMEDIIITGHFSTAALYFNEYAESIISNCEFNNITTNGIYYIGDSNKEPGRPIYARYSNLTLNDCTFESNSHVEFSSKSNVIIEDCTFTSNSANYGGAIYADSNSNLTVTGSKFTLNEGSFSGGAISASNLKVSDSEFTLNSAVWGGAVYIGYGTSILNITDSVFDSNNANMYRNIYASPQVEYDLKDNEYDLKFKINENDGSYGSEYILEGTFDWGCNLNNNYTLLAGVLDNETLFGEVINFESTEFKINLGMLSGGTHEIRMPGLNTQKDSVDYFYGHDYYSDLWDNEFYLNDPAYAKIFIDKARTILNLEVNNVLIPETPVLNVSANFDYNYTIFVGNKYYQLEVVNGKGSMPLPGLDLGNHTVVAMRDADENFYLAMNFTTFTISKTYSNFLVVSTNVEYDTLAEAVANSGDEDTIYIKNGTYKDTKVVISNKTLDIIALETVVFDAQGGDANFIIVSENAEVYIYGITFRGLHNRNTNYGAIVNHGYLSLDSCNFTDNKITKTSFAGNGGAAIFSDGESLEIDNCNFINNVAPLKVSTAAVTSLGSEDISITDSKFINNTAREGGAVHFKNIAQFVPAIISCDFKQNTAVKGSAIYIGNNSRYASVSLSNFVKNNIKNSLGEKAQLEGGVIYVNANTTYVTVDISLSNFENNSNKDVDGGVLCLDGSSNAYIDGCVFNNNSGKLGSAILIKNPNNKKLSLVIDDSYFANNHATTGAIVTSPKVTAFLDECIFLNNTGENRHIYSNGFTVAHDTLFDVKDVKINALSVPYGNNSIIKGSADIGVNIYALANLTVAGENVNAEIKNNKFTYNAGVLNYGKYTAVLNNIVDMNENTYIMDSATVTFKVNRVGIQLNVSVDNITYGENLKVVETLPSTALGTISYQLNGKEYTKAELESLKLDAGKYTLVASYNNEDFAPSSTVINFEVYKANPTISVADVEVDYNGTIIVNIQTNVPSIYTIKVGDDYETIKYINGSRSVVIDKIFEPGTYTIKVTSQERVNYISNYTEAILNVTKNPGASLLGASNINTYPDEAVLGVSAPENIVFEGDDLYYSTSNTKMTLLSANNEDILTSDDDYFDEYDYPFLYQEDEDSYYEYYETLEEAIDAASLMGGIITVRGGTYYWKDGNTGFDIEGELELTIRAFEGEEVIFDCQHQSDFLYLTYDTEVEIIETAPPIPIIYTTEGPTITLENITVINGYANSDGGVIEMDAGSLTLLNCNFYNNDAEYGGVIYIGSLTSDQDADVIAFNTTFINNTARSEGGAIYISEGLEQFVSASFYACTFLDNYQGEGDEKTINYFAGPEVTEINSQYCVFDGFGTVEYRIDNINQTVTVKGSSTDILDSIVLLYFDQVPLYSIYNNGSRDFNVTFEDVMGGNYTIGVMDDHKFNTYIFKDKKFEMKVPNFIISADEVYENLTDAISNVTDNGIIYANLNYHDEENLEIDITKSFTLTNFRDRMVVFDGSSTHWFFTIAEGCNVTIENIDFVDGGIKNHATFENYGSLTFKNCTFTGFETSAIVYNSYSLNIINSEFSLNFINNAIVLNDGKLFIDGVEFSSNIINTNSIVYNNGNAEIVSSNFTENINNGNGGAIYNKNLLTIKDTVFNENEGINGGVVYNEGTLEVLNSDFEDNTANGYGGAIFNDGNANIFNSSFSGGFSENDGGALYNNNITTVNNSTLVANTATGNGGAIYNNKTLKLTESFFGINFALEYANIYNAGDVQEFTGNIFDFYDVILYVPDGEYGISTTITGTLDPQFNMDLKLILPEFVNYKDAEVNITDGIFEYETGVLPKGIYDVILNETLYDANGNIYSGEAIFDRLIVYKANVYINLTVDDMILKNSYSGTPVLKINASKNGTFQLLFNNRLSTFTIADTTAEITLDSVGEGNYSVMVVREGDENYNDAANMTSFTVSEYLGNFLVNSTGGKFDTLAEAIKDSGKDGKEDIIYVIAGTYTGEGNTGVTVSGKKLTITPIGVVEFDGSYTNSGFLTINGDADITLEDIVFSGFKDIVINNNGNLTVDGCAFVNNTLYEKEIISSENSTGNLKIVESGFYDNKAYRIIRSASDILINGSLFENNTAFYESSDIIEIISVNSVNIISTEFVENTVGGHGIYVSQCSDVHINAEFYNNTLKTAINSYDTSDLNIEDSIFTGNTFEYAIYSQSEHTQKITGSTFTENTVRNVVYSYGNKLYVIGSTFSANTLSGNGTLNIKTGDATIDDCLFVENKADHYRNIYSESYPKISNTTFDAINVDFNVSDIDYGQTERINGTIDIGTNFDFNAELEIGGKTYIIFVFNNKFTYTTGIIDGGEHNVVLNGKDRDSNTYIFDKITKVLAVNRVDPGLNVTIANITQGEKLEITVNLTKITNSTIRDNAINKILYLLNRDLNKTYNKAQMENITLTSGNYVVAVAYPGNKNYYPVAVPVHVEVYKKTSNITVSDAEVDYGEDIEINVKVDVADYYTVFIDDRYDESVSLYIDGSRTFTIPSENFKPGKYEIKVYKIETDDNPEAYAYANLTVNKAKGIFNLSNNTIEYGENATVSVEVPTNAYGNITYTVCDEEERVVYTITQSCQKDLVVPDLKAGAYIVAGTFEGDDYYTKDSIINHNIITVNSKGVDLSVIVENITYGENATVTVNANVDGEYIVTLGNKTYPVNVINGSGNVSIPDLTVGSHVVITVANITNYFAFNETEFGVTPKAISIIVYADSIAFGDNATVWVYSEVDGEYNVRIYEQNYTANVVGGKGNATIPNLGIDENILVSVTIKDGNYSTFNTTMFNVFTKLIPATISVGDITYGENVTVTVKADFDANYTVTIWDENYTLSVINGTGVKSIPNLAAGKNILASVYYKDAEYGASNYTIFNIHPKQVSVRISIENITYGENATVVVEADVDGNYTVSIRNVNYTVSVSDGKGNITIPNLSAGSQIEATVKRDDNYTGFNSTTFNVIKSKTDVDIELGNVTGSAAPITLRLPADAGGNVSLYVNGILTQTVNVVNGSANITVTNLKYGSNNVTVVYSGDDNYGPINKSVVMNRNTTIIASDMTRGYNSGMDYTATILDDNGTAVANTTVTIKVGTTTYTVKTDANGVLNFNNKLAVGNYGVAIVNPVTGEYKLTNLKIVGRITGNKNVKIYFADGTKYKVRIVGDDGNYVGAGEIVKMNVAGKTYTVKTDKNGYATLKLSLKVKTHTITVTYKGFTTKNKVTVKSVVKPVKKTVKVKKTAKKLKIKVKLKGKKILKKKRVYLKFKGKTYKAKTNKKGIATFKVPKKVIKKLKKGKKYQAIFTYKAKANGKTIQNTAKCYIKVK